MASDGGMTSQPHSWGKQGISPLLYTLTSSNCDALTVDQAKGLLNRLDLPPEQLAQCLIFQNKVVPKQGILKPVVMVRPPQSVVCNALTYDLMEVMLSIFALLTHEENSSHVQVLSLGLILREGQCVLARWKHGSFGTITASLLRCGVRLMCVSQTQLRKTGEYASLLCRSISKRVVCRAALHREMNISPIPTFMRVHNRNRVDERIFRGADFTSQLLRDSLQAVQELLVTLIKIGESHGAPLLIPTLRTEDAFLQSVIELCYHWVAIDLQPLVSLSILAGFASPCNSADLPAARSACTMIRRRINFRYLLQSSLVQAWHPNAAVVLGRFWDAVLGTPPQSLSDATTLSIALTELARAPELDRSMLLLLSGLQSRATEPHVASRYGGCAPLLRISSALLQSEALVEALICSGLDSTLYKLLETIMNVATLSMTGESCNCMQDLLAAMSLEVIAVAISQPRLFGVFHGSSVTDPETNTNPMKQALEQLVAAAVRRQSIETTVPVLPRLPESLRRFYGALQKYGGRSIVELLQTCCGRNPDGAIRVNQHLTSLAKSMDSRSCPVSAGSMRLGSTMLPRHSAKHGPHSNNAYPVLPPGQAFVDVKRNRMDNPEQERCTQFSRLIRVYSGELEEADAEVCEIVRDQKWAKLGLGDEGRQLVTMEPIDQNQIVCEYCGEILVDEEDFVAQLANYSSIWPPQLCMLRFGSSKLVLDISRVASVARFAEHSSQPSCEVKSYRINGEPRLFVVAKVNLVIGDPITIFYTHLSLGGTVSHRQADWILKIREMRRQHGRTNANEKVSVERQHHVDRGNSRQLVPRLRPLKSSAKITDDSKLLRALKQLRSSPVDFLLDPVKAKVRKHDLAQDSLSSTSNATLSAAGPLDLEARTRDAAATMLGMGSDGTPHHDKTPSGPVCKAEDVLQSGRESSPAACANGEAQTSSSHEALPDRDLSPQSSPNRSAVAAQSDEKSSGKEGSAHSPECSMESAAPSAFKSRVENDGNSAAVPSPDACPGASHSGMHYGAETTHAASPLSSSALLARHTSEFKHGSHLNPVASNVPVECGGLPRSTVALASEAACRSIADYVPSAIQVEAERQSPGSVRLPKPPSRTPHLTEESLFPQSQQHPLHGYSSHSSLWMRHLPGGGVGLSPASQSAQDVMSSASMAPPTGLSNQQVEQKMAELQFALQSAARMRPPAAKGEMRPQPSPAKSQLQLHLLQPHLLQQKQLSSKYPLHESAPQPSSRALMRRALTTHSAHQNPASHHIQKPCPPSPQSHPYAASNGFPGSSLMPSSAKLPSSQQQRLSQVSQSPMSWGAGRVPAPHAFVDGGKQDNGARRVTKPKVRQLKRISHVFICQMIRNRQAQAISRQAQALLINAKK